MNQRQPVKPKSYAFAISALLPLVILIPVQMRVTRPMLLVERFWPGAGWIEIALLAVYSLWLFQVLSSSRKD